MDAEVADLVVFTKAVDDRVLRIASHGAAAHLVGGEQADAVGCHGELVDLSLPVALAEEYPEFRLQLAPLIKQGLLVEQGDSLVLDASMKDLVLDVNGVEIPLPPLL